ncbi:MAG: hypothetical protein COZ31_04470, partial [Nitrospirae bacterium CG_4_10_14_3_um_filter_44_29]
AAYHLKTALGCLNKLGHLRLLRKDNSMLFIRKLKHMRLLYKKSLITFEKLNASVQSWLGHAKHADNYGLRCRILTSKIQSGFLKPLFQKGT